MAKVPSIRAFCILTTIVEIWEQFESSLSHLNKIRSAVDFWKPSARPSDIIRLPTGQTPPKMVYVAGAEPIFQSGGLLNKHSVFARAALEIGAR